MSETIEKFQTREELAQFIEQTATAAVEKVKLEGRKKGHEEYLKVLREIEARPGGKDPDYVDVVLRWGIEFNEWGAQWCEKHLKRLRSAKAA